MDQDVLVHLLSELAAWSPLGDAQLRNSGEREEHGQPERALFHGGGSHQVKDPSRCSLGGGNVSVSPGSRHSQRGRDTNIHVVYVLVVFPEGEQSNHKSQAGF